MFIWTSHNLALAQRRWAEGASGAEIGREIGATRNAVIGKLHREAQGSRRGHRRTDGNFARTLALLDKLGIRKRGVPLDLRISREGREALFEHAAKLRVCPSGLAAYYVESALRQEAT